MNSELSFLVMPLTIFWLTIITGIFFFLLRRKRTGMFFGFTSIIWLALISFFFFPELLVRSLENRFPPLLEVPHFNQKDSVFILVLGSGYTENKNLPPNDQLSLNSLCRLTEAIRLHRLLNTSKIVLLGSKQIESINESESFMKTALAMGVDEHEIRLLGTPKNTRMEAFDYTRKFGTNNTLVVVTDAIHMPRAILLFRKEGQIPIPAPTNHLVKSNRKYKISDWFPSSLNIGKMEYAMHEIGGLIYARLFYWGEKR